MYLSKRFYIFCVAAVVLFLAGYVFPRRWMKCHWMGMAELGVGALAALLGVLMFLQRDRGVRKGLSQALIGISVLAAALPGGLIGGYKNLQMPCQTVSIPVLYALSAGLLLSSLLALRAACGKE